jgi:hypothetical protein
MITERTMLAAVHISIWTAVKALCGVCLMREPSFPPQLLTRSPKTCRERSCSGIPDLACFVEVPQPNSA